MYIKNTICKIFAGVTVLIMVVGLEGCKKQVEVGAPYTNTNAGNVFEEDATAIAALTGIYTELSQYQILAGSGGMTIYTGLSSDELTLYDGVSDNNLSAYYTNSLQSKSNLDFGTDAWKMLYLYVYSCNAAIEGLNTATALTSSVKQQLLGEAKFIRAFLTFYLINLYGDIPLTLTSDYKVNALLSKSSKSQVYQQIEKDLTEAYDLLSGDYLDGNLKKYSGLEERVRPTKWSAAALLARAYLYEGNYVGAEAKATELITNTSKYALNVLDEVFLENSKEAIWQLQPVNEGRNTEDATTFILTSSGPTTSTEQPVYLSDQLLGSFENGDQRKTNWVDSVVPIGSTTAYYYPFKYKNNSPTVTEYLMLLRLGEQYLIRAEARAQLGNTSDALADLNAIRFRAGLPDYSGATDKNSLLAAILHERQVELFTELGHRWLDLKRTGTVDAVMTKVTPTKTGGVVQWNPYKQLYPIPFSDIQNAPNLTQNSGY